MTNKPKELPSVDYLRECFDYNPETGILTWKERPRHHFKGEGWYKRHRELYNGREAGNLQIGYKCVSLNGTPYFVHRIIYKIMTGEDPGGFDINHKDCNRSNNKWENLELVTRSGNLKHAFDFYKKSHVGEKHPYSKLKEEDVLEIRRLCEQGLNQSKIASKFGVSRLTVSSIKFRRAWSHI